VGIVAYGFVEALVKQLRFVVEAGFPLTPALSLRERENGSQMFCNATV